ncbi:MULTISPECIES: LPD7 domain-containing protein [unclassified Sphingopyxis]|uniref:LPD7 domain-containing protein n=1 Tax=unclassified Sphingopyxis TaxID=2614943 RepID=UPI0024ADFED2|nr:MULTISPECIES: LPD7 domain-containing protein [unclassified Sphingopyxis]
MADKIDGNAPSGRTRTATPNPAKPEPETAKPKRKAETPTLTDDLTGKFLRIGNALYRTSDDKKPIARLEPDRLKTTNIDALPDIVRIAKANGWTSIRINGGDTFKKAAYLAAAAQGLTVENYTPSNVVQAEAVRLQTRLAERDKRREAKSSTGKSARPTEETITLKALSERFLSQTHEQNSRDPELRRAQSLVAQTISITRSKYPDDSAKASKDVEAKRNEVARRIANGDKIAAIQVSNQQTHRVREVTQDQALMREGRTR